MIDLFVVGFGGFAKETFWYAKELEFHKFKIKGFVNKFDKNQDFIPMTYCGVPIYNEEDFDYSNKCIVIGTGYPKLREKIFNNININFNNVDFPNVISPTTNIMSKETLRLGQGIIIATGCAITCDITLESFVNLNMNTTIGHDTVMKPFATTATNVSISGNVFIGKRVHLGNNSCVKEYCIICNDVLIGMGGVVVKSITEAGTYVGCPVKKLVKENV